MKFLCWGCGKEVYPYKDPDTCNIEWEHLTKTNCKKITPCEANKLREVQEVLLEFQRNLYKL